MDCLSVKLSNSSVFKLKHNCNVPYPFFLPTEDFEALSSQPVQVHLSQKKGLLFTVP